MVSAQQDIQCLADRPSHRRAQHHEQPHKLRTAGSNLRSQACNRHSHEAGPSDKRVLPYNLCLHAGRREGLPRGPRATEVSSKATEVQQGLVCIFGRQEGSGRSLLQHPHLRVGSSCIAHIVCPLRPSLVAHITAPSRHTNRSRHAPALCWTLMALCWTLMAFARQPSSKLCTCTPLICEHLSLMAVPANAWVTSWAAPACAPLGRNAGKQLGAAPHLQGGASREVCAGKRALVQIYQSRCPHDQGC